MGKTCGGTYNHRSVVLLTEFKRKLYEILCFLAVGRLQHRHLRRSAHHTGILLVLRAVKTRIIRCYEYQTAVYTTVGNGIERIACHIYAHVLHGEHGTYTGNSRTDCHLSRYLLIRRPLGVNLLILYNIFADLRTRSSRIRCRYLHACFVSTAGNGLVTEHNLLCHNYVSFLLFRPL